MIPLLALLIAAAPAQYPPAEDAGISFLAPPADGISFRSNDGTGWQRRPAHRGPLDKGMNGDRLYDFHLGPGSTVNVETSVSRGGRIAARTAMRLTVEADRRYFIHAAVQVSDPTEGCMGCLGLKSVAIPGDRSRRLWVYYSFNGISGPILF
jgi:hypothetical protein